LKKNILRIYETNPNTIIQRYCPLDELWRYSITKGGNQWYKISKGYFNYLKGKGIKEEVI